MHDSIHISFTEPVHSLWWFPVVLDLKLMSDAVMVTHARVYFDIGGGVKHENLVYQQS